MGDMWERDKTKNIYVRFPTQFSTVTVSTQREKSCEFSAPYIADICT
jgi:hypothetical protein